MSSDHCRLHELLKKSDTGSYHVAFPQIVNAEKSGNEYCLFLMFILRSYRVSA